MYLRAASLPVTLAVKDSLTFFRRGSRVRSLPQLGRPYSSPVTGHSATCTPVVVCCHRETRYTLPRLGPSLSLLTFHLGLSPSLHLPPPVLRSAHRRRADRRCMMAIAAPEPSSPSLRHARVAPGNLFRRMSAQAMGMEAAALCHRSHWVPKSSRSSCSNCRRSIRLWAGKHHCRLCGEIVCGACSTKRILFQKKSVRTCDDCVDANVQNISEINRRRSTPEFLRAHTSPAALDDDDERFERLSLPIRAASSRGLHRRHSSVANSTPPPEAQTETSSTAMTVLKYRVTFSWQTQVLSLVVAALVACALKLLAQV